MDNAPTTYAAHYETQTFNDVLVEQLKSTPWLMMSVAIHVLIAIVLNFMGTSQRPDHAFNPVDASIDPIVEEQKQPDEIEEVEKIEVPEPTNVPEIPEVEIDQKLKVDRDEDDEAPDDNDAPTEHPFDSTNVGDPTIGLGGGPGAFGDRGPGGRKTRRPPVGGVPDAIRKGLDWLARHQSGDGRWDCDGYMRNGDAKKGPLCTGKGSAMYDVGVTGLSLLAYLGAGNTHREGPYKEQVRAGLKWLKGQQDAEGCFGSRGDPHFTYNHAIAALAMAEAYGMTKSGLWKNCAQNGIDFCMKSQNPYKAWRYGVRPGDNDSSVTGWMVMALKSAKLSGLDVNDTSLRWAKDWIVEMTDEDTGRVGYTKRGELPVRAEGRLEAFPADQSESMTAVGVLTRVFAGEDPRSSSAIKAGAELMSKRLPVWEPESGKVDMYYWYYASLALFQVGGREWTAWTSRMKKHMIEPQRGDGNFAGSWDPCGPWGEDGGRVYSTALMTMCMEVFFRYPKVFGAGRG